jgi:rhodanese-related sulfurtransferase
MAWVRFLLSGAKGSKHLILSDFATIVNLFRQARRAALVAAKMYPIVWEVFMLDLEITARDLAAQLKSGETGLVLLDVREPWEFATAQIAGSKLMPMGEIPSRVFEELDPEAHIIAVCHSGVRSLNVAVWMRNQGFEKVQSLSGGIDSWSREVDPTVPRY